MAYDVYRPLLNTPPLPNCAQMPSCNNGATVCVSSNAAAGRPPAALTRRIPVRSDPFTLAPKKWGNAVVGIDPATGLPIVLDPGFLTGADAVPATTATDAQLAAERRRARLQRQRDRKAYLRQLRKQRLLVNKLNRQKTAVLNAARQNQGKKKRKKFLGIFGLGEDDLGCCKGCAPKNRMAGYMDDDGVSGLGEMMALGELMIEAEMGEFEIGEYVAEQLGEYDDLPELNGLGDQRAGSTPIFNPAEYGLRGLGDAGGADAGVYNPGYGPPPQPGSVGGGWFRNFVGDALSQTIPIIGPLISHATGLDRVKVTTPGGQQAIVLQRQAANAAAAKRKADLEAARAAKARAAKTKGNSTLWLVGGAAVLGAVTLVGVSKSRR